MKMKALVGGIGFAAVAAMLGQMQAGAVPGEETGVNGPDVIAVKLANNTWNGGTDSDITEYSPSGGKHAYTIATTSCNLGNQVAQWNDTGSSVQHPVIGQSIYRYMDGTFEQLGQSWLKHGFCAVNETGCLTCQPTNCNTLGVGCADTYWATLNDPAVFGGPKSLVNSWTGVHIHPYPGPTGGLNRGRIQVLTGEMTPAQNPGAVYYIEGQYITAPDEPSANRYNNVSHRRVTVNSPTNVQTFSPNSTITQQPAIAAWAVHDPLVSLVNNDSLFPNDGRFVLGYRVTDNGDGTWHYEYAVYNMNSDRAGQSFTVPVPDGVNITNVGYRDVDYHSGEVYDNTDWAVSLPLGGGAISWAGPTFAQNVNGNALRWGTLYNFRFDADTAPVASDVSLALFKPGTPSSLSFASVAPSAATAPCPGNANEDTVVDVFDLLDVLDAFGTCPDPCPDFCGPDVNEDCEVDVFDLLDVLDNFGACP